MSTVPTQTNPTGATTGPTLLPASQARTALLVVDVQVGLNVHDTPYYGKARSNPNFETNIARLLASVRNYNKTAPQPIHIIHVNHHSVDPHSPLHPSNTKTSAPQPCASPLADEPMLHKSANSSFVGTDLERMLRNLDPPLRQLLITGIATDHCVSTTTRMAADLRVCGGKRDGVVLVEDCTACFDGSGGKGGFGVEVVQTVSVESLRGEFAEVVRVADVEGVVLR